MAQPRTLAELRELTPDELTPVLFELLIQARKQYPELSHGRASIHHAIHLLGSANFGTSDVDPKLRQALCDSLQNLCERGFLWLNPHAEGVTGGHLEFTRKGRSATVEDVRSGWPSTRAALERFPAQATWDETMGAYFRMAVATHDAGVHEPALFLIGGAAERLIGLVEERVGYLLGSGRRKAGERLTALVELFKSKGDLATAELLEVIGNVARWSRNDIGHPKPTPPDVDPMMVAARICEFPSYAERVLRASESLVAT